ncbi:hypothetical protein D6C81_09643 [Aureobasidium pullulans]|nr:hypothetical protein D6C81_09643 [Aureobasidium pullulans]
MSANLAGYLFALIDAGSFFGRILGGLLANHVGQFNVITVDCYLSSLLLFCWLVISSSAGLVVFAVLFGAVSGAIIALMMPLFAHTADHPSKPSSPTIMGTLTASSSVPVLRWSVLF